MKNVPDVPAVFWPPFNCDGEGFCGGGRREAALKELAAVKSGLLWVWLRSQRSSSRRDDGSSDSAVQETMWALTGVRLSPPRRTALAMQADADTSVLGNRSSSHLQWHSV